MAEMVAMDPADIKKGKRQWPLYKPFCMRPNCKKQVSQRIWPGESTGVDCPSG